MPTSDETIVRTALAELFRMGVLLDNIKQRAKEDPAYAEVALVELRSIRSHLFSLSGFNRSTEVEDGPACRNCDKPISHGEYCGYTCEGMDRL